MIVEISSGSSISIECCVFFALRKALKDNLLTNTLIHHSNSGIQYCNTDYIKILNKNTIAISMTEENRCYENALTERVNGILKDEYTFKDFSQAEKACNEVIRHYNTRRPHWALKFKTPEQVHQGETTLFGEK